MPGESDMNRMQEEAVRRAREMQSRARFPPRQNRRTEQGNVSAASEQGNAQRQQAPSQTQSVPPPESENREPLSGTAAPASGGLLETLFQDKERTIILALLILLSGEESNHELMFALMFLLM